MSQVAERHVSRVTTADNVATVLASALDAGEGLLRLTPTWVPRSFLHPGKRIRLHPDDWYAYGAERGGIDLMPEMRTGPVNQYLPPRPRREGREASGDTVTGMAAKLEDAAPEGGFLGWLDKLLSD